ncbi:spore coat protein YsxE [Fervidibacillus albus]|uniref:Spore coat protein YsxE n=1 Tax=Fervidibacillus albus TaxID=2980026 RepID=A0A9E8LVG2_9BACI|nr:spore coat protein YsxE [Fervidibacillus albus]WAA10236.1 spore coat protein YsxE [Fervidibacillus albus]
MKESFKKIEELLKEFGIWPYDIQKKGKVYKIYSRDGIFALKRSSVQDFQRLFVHLQYLYKKGFYRFVPILPTIGGTYAVSDGENLFYLMPWFSEKKDGKTMEGLFRELGRLHSLSVKEWKIEKDVVETHYERTKEKWQAEIGFFDALIDQCERKSYMSPFEWKYVEYYNEFRKAYDYALLQLDIWKNETIQEGKMRSVIIHGNCDEDHFLFTEEQKGYFLSWEKSRFSSPFFDILPLLKKLLPIYPTDCDDCLNLLHVYFQLFPLRKGEESLMKSYLAQPGSIVSTLEQYRSIKANNKEYIYTKTLNRQYWQFKNTEYIVMKLEEKEANEKRNGNHRSFPS